MGGLRCGFNPRPPGEGRATGQIGAELGQIGGFNPRPPGEGRATCYTIRLCCHIFVSIRALLVKGGRLGSTTAPVMPAGFQSAPSW